MSICLKMLELFQPIFDICYQFLARAAEIPEFSIFHAKNEVDKFDSIDPVTHSFVYSLFTNVRFRPDMQCIVLSLTKKMIRPMLYGIENGPFLCQ